MARGFKSGGRQKGALNKINREMREALLSGGVSPLEYMLRVMRDETAETSRRDKMAADAAPYLHPRLAAVEHSGEVETSYVARMPAPVASMDEWQKRYAPPKPIQ
jgi:hypothetical protein